MKSIRNVSLFLLVLASFLVVGCSTPSTKELEDSMVIGTKSTDVTTLAPDNTTSIQYKILSNGTDSFGTEWWDVTKLLVTKENGKVTECKCIGQFSTSDRGFIKSLTGEMLSSAVTGIAGVPLLPKGPSATANSSSKSTASATYH